MSIVLFPADAVAGAPSYTGEMIRQALAADLAGASTARPLGARSGVRPGTSTTGTVTITGTGPYTVNINPHGGVLDLETSATAGPYRYSVNTTQPFSVTAQGGSARTDVVYIQLNDPAESDGSSTPAAVPGYTANTSSVPNSRCLLLATLNVPASGGGAPTVTWAAPFATAAGGLRPVSTLSQAGTGNYNGEPIVTLDTGVPYWWNTTNSAWYTKPVQPPMACRYYCNAAMNLTNGGRTQLTLAGKSFDYSPGGTLIASNVFTATEAGLYDVRWRVSANVNNNPQDFYSLIASSGFGTEYAYGTRVDVRSGTSADTWASGGADLVPLAVGGTIILGANNPAANIMVVTTGTTNTYLSINKVG